MVRVQILLIVCSLLYVHCQNEEDMEPQQFPEFAPPDLYSDPPMEFYEQYARPVFPAQPKTSSVRTLKAKKMVSPDGYEMEVETGVDESGEVSYQVEAPVKKQKKAKKFKTPKVFKKFLNLFKRKSKKQAKAEKAAKRAEAEKKSKRMPLPEQQPEYQPQPQTRFQPVPVSKPVPQPRFQPTPVPQPRFQPVPAPQPRFPSKPIPGEGIQQPFQSPFGLLPQPRLPAMPTYDRPIQTGPYPMMKSIEIELEKVDSNPLQGFVRTVNYNNGRPVIREKRINAGPSTMFPNSGPIIFDPYRTLVHTLDGQKKLMESLDEMFIMKRLGDSSKNPFSPKKDEKKSFVPCERRKTCEECTVDFSCYYCSSKKQCIPSKYFGSDSFTGYHCPASDIYYFETCKVKSFVFMFFLIIFVLCLIFAVLIMGFSLIYRRTRRAKIYNIIREKEDEIDAEGKPHPY